MNIPEQTEVRNYFADARWKVIGGEHFCIGVNEFPMLVPTYALTPELFFNSQRRLEYWTGKFGKDALIIGPSSLRTLARFLADRGVYSPDLDKELNCDITVRQAPRWDMVAGDWIERLPDGDNPHLYRNANYEDFCFAHDDTTLRCVVRVCRMLPSSLGVVEDSPRQSVD